MAPENGWLENEVSFWGPAYFQVRNGEMLVSGRVLYSWKFISTFMVYFSSWWFQPIWKICSSNWVHLPQFSGWKFQKSLSCHHRSLVYFFPSQLCYNSSFLFDTSGAFAQPHVIWWIAGSPERSWPRLGGGLLGGWAPRYRKWWGSPPIYKP